MKKINILLLAFVILFSACRKEEVILEDPTVSTSPPIIVEGAIFTGKVIDFDGNPVATKIDVYQNETLLGTISSDEDGSYNSSYLPIGIDQEVTFAIENELYANKYKRTKAQQELHENKDIRLIPKEESFAPDNPLFNPGSAELVKIYGNFADRYGKIIQNADVVALYEVSLPGAEPRIFYGLFDKTDENGFFEFLVPNDQEIYFYSTPERTGNISFCWTNINKENAFDIISPLVGLDHLGILTEDTEVLEKEDLSLTEFEYIVHGDLLDCDGIPVTAGEVSLEVNYISNGDPVRLFLTTEEFDENGAYWFDFAACSDLVDIKITGQTADGASVSLSLNDIPEGGIHLAPLKACGESTLFLRSTMELAIGDNHFFEEIVFIHDSIEPSFNFSVTGSNTETGFVLLDIQDIKEGDNPVRRFVVDYIDQNPEPFAFNAPTNELIAKVSSIENGEITGSIIGEVETNGLGIQTINAKFVIKY